MNDFTVLQRRIVDLMSSPVPAPPPSYSPSRSPPYGHLLLQQCAHDAQVILDADFATGTCPTSSGAGTGGEQEKAQLQRQVLPSHPLLLSTVHPPIPVNSVAHSRLISQMIRVHLDASTRRFQAQKIYLRASAAHRWAQYRGTEMMDGEGQQNSTADDFLRAEISLITGQAVYDQLRAADLQAECWVGEDPPLTFILRWMDTLQEG